MVLREIDEASDMVAASLLARGFPSRPRAFWDQAIARLRQNQRVNTGPIGYLTRMKDEDVGVLLTIHSRRHACTSSPQDVVNLSSWFIDERYRWIAPRLLQRVTSDPQRIFTDLTPTPPVQQIIRRLDFSPWTDGTFLFALPLFAMTRGTNDVIPAERIRNTALPASKRALLDHHLRWDCVGAAIRDSGEQKLALFSPTRRAGIPILRLIYADSKDSIYRNMGPLARLLLRRGFPFLAVHGEADEKVPRWARFIRRSPTFCKGSRPRPDVVDFSYSEFVLLGI